MAILKWQCRGANCRLCSVQDRINYACKPCSCTRGNTNMFSPRTGNDSGNTAHMLHSILKQDQIHDCIGLVVLIQSLHARSKVDMQFVAILTVVSWTARCSSLAVSTSTSCHILLCKLIVHRWICQLLVFDLRQGMSFKPQGVDNYLHQGFIQSLELCNLIVHLVT